MRCILELTYMVVKWRRCYTALDKHLVFEHKIVNIFFPISLYTYIFTTQKNRLNEKVLLSTHNMCFGWEIRKLFFWYTLLTKVLLLC